jgi:pentatricopeptide repeat protein
LVFDTVATALYHLGTTSDHGEEGEGAQQQMRVLGVAPDQYTYNMLLRSEVVAGAGELTDGVLSVAREMRESGCHVDSHLYSTLISLHTRSGNVDEAVKLLGRAAADGVELDAGVYHAVMGGFAEKGDVRRTVR